MPTAPELELELEPQLELELLSKRRSPSKPPEPMTVDSESENENENESESDGSGSGSESSLLSASGASEGRALALRRALSSDAILVRGLALAPVPVLPQQLSRATEIQLFLARVERVAIRDVIEREEGIVYYVVDVYRYQQQKGLPSTRGRGTSAASSSLSASIGPREDRQPDYRIEQRYSSFARLRRNVAKIARKRHPHGRACGYCHALLDHLEAATAKPCLKVKFTASVDDRKGILGTFLTELVFAVRDGHAGCARSSHGYHIIPALVRRFLAEQTGNNFFRY